MDVVHRGVLSQVSTRPWRDHRPAPTGNYRRFVASSAWGEIPHLCGLEVGRTQDAGCFYRCQAWRHSMRGGCPAAGCGHSLRRVHCDVAAECLDRADDSPACLGARVIDLTVASSFRTPPKAAKERFPCASSCSI